MPRAIAKERYAEAIALYAAKAASRATAVYLVGDIAFPGLSDIDLLIVVRESRRDNSQFFSVFNRLPQRFHCLFRHQPSVLPEAALDVFQHSCHSRPSLLIGDDLLKDHRLLLTRDEQWCKLLEGFCNQAAYLSGSRKQGSVSGRWAVAHATSLRYVLQHLDVILSTDHAARFAREIDELRAVLLSNPANDHILVAEMWNKLCGKMLWLENALRSLMPLGQSESLQHFSDRVLQGRLMFDALEPGRMLKRRQRIDFYHAELARLKFSYGHLFPHAAYDTRSQRYSQWWLERRLFSMYYQARTQLAS